MSIIVDAYASLMDTLPSAIYCEKEFYSSGRTGEDVFAPAYAAKLLRAAIDAYMRATDRRPDGRPEVLDMLVRQVQKLPTAKGVRNLYRAR
jgi:hypothetical protein